MCDCVCVCVCVCMRRCVLLVTGCDAQNHCRYPPAPNTPPPSGTDGVTQQESPQIPHCQEEMNRGAATTNTLQLAVLHMYTVELVLIASIY